MSSFIIPTSVLKEEAPKFPFKMAILKDSSYSGSWMA